MENHIVSTKKDPWQFDLTANESGVSKYVCVTGNSGVGKSTLIDSLGAKLDKIAGNTVVIDEKSLHHPFLPYLFFEPLRFSFELQLNFMLQRAMIIKHWLGHGYNLVMERSHIEELVFIRHLLREGSVTKMEHDTYVQLWEQINERLQHPDLLIYLNVPPKVSIERLTSDERSGRRIKEFPDESTKKRWIHSWYELYSERIEELKQLNFDNMTILEVDGNTSVNDITSLALKAMDL